MKKTTEKFGFIRLTNNMEKYDYRKAICEDIRYWLNENDEWKSEYADEDGVWLRDDNRDEIAQDLNDRLWVEDGVTGNASGSYTFNAWKAEEYLCHNLDLLGEALSEFGCGPEYLMEKGVEACDVTIRCYLLGECIERVLDEMI